MIRSSVDFQKISQSRSAFRILKCDSTFFTDTESQLFSLTSNIARLSQQINLLGTKRETDRVRERVNDLLEEARSGFRDVGEGVKRLTTWEDLNV